MVTSRSCHLCCSLSQVGDNLDWDDDGDGTPDRYDKFPLDPLEQLDTDGDGIGNRNDTNDDGDNVTDAYDAFPLDPDESFDMDRDGPSRPFRVSVFAARTLNATVQSRVTLSLRQER